MIPSVIMWNQVISKTDWYDGVPEIRGLPQWSSSPPPATFNHSYSFTPHWSSQCWELWDGVAWGFVWHLPTPKMKEWPYHRLNYICHPLSCGYHILDITQWHSIMSNFITSDTETQSGRWSNRNPLLVRLGDCNFSRIQILSRCLNEPSTQGQHAHTITLYLFNPIPSDRL